MKPPVFIVGVHRSGTTLLRYMLNSGGKIYIPPESDFIPRFFLGQVHKPLTEAQVASMLSLIFGKYRFVRQWQGPPLTASEAMSAMIVPTPAAFLDVLYGRYAQQNGASRWGDKTPIYTSYMDLLAELFPTAQFIYLIRDGRDVGLSMLDKWGRKFHFDIYFTARKWVQRSRQAQESAKKLGNGRFYQLFYEELIRDPERYLREICTFLDEPYDPKMAQPHLLGQQEIAPGSFHAPIRQSINPSKIARWKQEMSLPDQRLFQAVAGDLLAEYGYELPTLPPMPLAEKWRWATLAAKYHLLQNGRNGLQAIGLMPPN